MTASSSDVKVFRTFRKFIGFIVAKPPCVIFVIFIGMFALAFLSLGYYVQHQALLDDEKSQEWNKLYASVLPLKICLSNSSSVRNSSFISGQDQRSLVNISMPYAFLLPRAQEHWIKNLTLLSSSLPYFYMHLKDEHAHHTIQMWIDIDKHSLTEECADPKASSKLCNIKLKSCITMSLPRKALPSSQPPQSCNASLSSVMPRGDFMVINPGVSNMKRNADICGGRVEFSLARFSGYHPEVFLSWEERSKVNLRLQIASYILFVILLSFILYALIKGKPLKPGLKKGVPGCQCIPH